MQTITQKKEGSVQRQASPNTEVENFKFLKVEDFFNNYQNEWNKIGDVIKYNINNDNDSIELCFQNVNGNDCWLVIKFPTPNSFRLRFNPQNEKLEQYPKANTRTIVKDIFDELSDSLDRVKIEKVLENEQIIECNIIDHEKNKNILKIEINLKPYSLKVYKYKNNKDYFEIMSDSYESIYYKERIVNTIDGNITEYSCIQSRQKPGWFKN
jgi:predicted secreted protein